MIENGGTVGGGCLEGNIGAFIIWCWLNSSYLQPIPAVDSVDHSKPDGLIPVLQAAEEDDLPVKKEKTHFIVKLTELKAADKVKLIKEVKNCMQGLNLVQVRSIMNSVVRLACC